jgi:glycosyltransferase involved in cell wall biosynthesis
MEPEPASSRVSIVIPCYEMHGTGAEYLACALHSIFLQTWKHVEVVVSDNAQDDSITQVVNRWRHLLPLVHIRPGTHQSTDTLNAGIRVATGDVVRILFQDDLLFGPDSLGQMIQEFHRGARWCVGPYMHLIDGRLVRPLTPFASTAMACGVNTIGPPSVLSFVNATPLLFDEDLVWLMDCEYYVRLLRRYGPPARIKQFNTIVRVGEHQLTNHIPEQVKSREVHIVLNAHPEYRRFRGLRTAWARGRRALHRVRACLPFSDTSTGARAGTAFLNECTGQPPR